MRNNLKNQMVNSSFIQKLNWNEDNSMTMWLNGNIYVVKNLTADEAKDWLGAKSVSNYFQSKIKPFKDIHRSY